MRNRIVLFLFVGIMLTLSVALLEPVRAGRTIGQNQKKSNEPVCRAMLPARHTPSPSFVTDLLRGHVDLGTQDRWLQSWTVPLGSRSNDIVVPSLVANSATAVASAVQGAIVDISVGPDNQLEFQPSFQVPRNAQDEARSSVYAQRFLDLLEDQVRRYPANSNEYLFWKEPEQSVV